MSVTIQDRKKMSLRKNNQGQWCLDYHCGMDSEGNSDFRSSYIDIARSFRKGLAFFQAKLEDCDSPDDQRVVFYGPRASTYCLDVALLLSNRLHIPIVSG